MNTSTDRGRDWRRKQIRAAFETANAQRKRVLASVTWFGPSSCDSCPPTGHPLLQQLKEGRLRDEFTNEELADFLGMPGAGIRAAMGGRETVPTALCVFYEAMRDDGLRSTTSALSSCHPFPPTAATTLTTPSPSWPEPQLQAGLQ
eukprot:TRINITY_DN12293_c0_g1_i1.p2 TRINITY_DN12293_c0_g1~~TRINITY_DN12293_c0_g1_i1.p2  ORF type:complete len:146 (-),score=6.83 TRINITY_DN12293_c0_g1_i1:1122-1559(-)